MKAKISGIELEGTPEEIMEFKRLQEEKASDEYFKIPKQKEPTPYVKSTGWKGTGNLEAKWPEGVITLSNNTRYTC